MASGQEVEMLRRQLDELTAQMIKIRQQSSSTAMNAAVPIQRIRGYARSCLSCLAENIETITNSGGGDSTTRTAVCNLAVLAHDAYTERSTESGEESWKHNGFEAYRQLCLMYGNRPISKAARNCSYKSRRTSSVSRWKTWKIV